MLNVAKFLCRARIFKRKDFGCKKNSSLEEGAFASVWKADKADVCDEFKVEAQASLLTRHSQEVGRLTTSHPT
jgi:hypothetical protein